MSKKESQAWKKTKEDLELGSKTEEDPGGRHGREHRKLEDCNEF